MATKNESGRSKKSKRAVEKMIRELRDAGGSDLDNLHDFDFDRPKRLDREIADLDQLAREIREINRANGWKRV